MPARHRLVVLALLLMPAGSARTASAQDVVFLRGLSAEESGRHREAADAYRAALGGANFVPAILGLERVYAEMGLGDSLLVVLDSAIAARPREPVFRAVLMRTHRFAGRHDAAREAFEQWIRDVPRDAAPYREYARMLLQDGRSASADSVLQRASRALGSTRELQAELAHLRARTGQWGPSAHSWRAAVSGAPYLEQAAVFALAPAPEAVRPAIRTALLAPPVEVGARAVLAALELGWGAPRAGWAALQDLAPDSGAVVAWINFAERAEHADAWLVARDALAAAYAARPAPDVAMRAARAALAGNDAASAVAFSERAARALDSAGTALIAVPTWVRALAMLGRAEDAERLLGAHARWLADDEARELARAVAFGWIRTGDVSRARRALRGAGAAEDDAAAGWLALYSGDLATARTVLRAVPEPTPETVAALALLTRTRADSGPGLGRAFLALARGDSVQAAESFEAASRGLPDAGSLLLATAARLRAARGEEDRAIALWRSIVERHEDSPEAAEADLEWARALRRRGDASGAISRLEHLILTYPRSALVAQARREMELLRRGVPPTS